MRVVDVCRVVAEFRREHAPGAILVATMSAMFALDELGESRLRIDSVPLMGGAAGLGLGLALAQPARTVFVLDGDASLLMELGGLVTVANAAPGRFVHMVVNNATQFAGLFNLARPGGGTPGCDFTAVARGAGYRVVRRIADTGALHDMLATSSAVTGPVFIELVVEPDGRRFGPGNPQPAIPDLQFTRMREAVVRLRGELAVDRPGRGIA